MTANISFQIDVARERRCACRPPPCGSSRREHRSARRTRSHLERQKPDAAGGRGKAVGRATRPSRPRAGPSASSGWPTATCCGPSRSRIGLIDGQFAELVTGDVEAGPSELRRPALEGGGSRPMRPSLDLVAPVAAAARQEQAALRADRPRRRHRHRRRHRRWCRSARAAQAADSERSSRTSGRTSSSCSRPASRRAGGVAGTGARRSPPPTPTAIAEECPSVLAVSAARRHQRRR